ncbi:MAG: DUF2520 domain-containing protein [Planctomycetes bacterium]|nr:DUF2520 domain-containing protein [Planctomycetota bacterium]
MPSSSRKGTTSTSKIGFLGAGAAATALALAARRRGLAVAAIWSPSGISARALARRCGKGTRAVSSPDEAAAASDLLILAVPDRAIVETARRAAAGVRRGALVVHLSGAAPLSDLAPLRRAGARIGGFHPIQTFPDRKGGAEKIEDSTVGIRGDARAAAELRRLAAKLRMRALRFPERGRIRYHAAAVMASNLVVALMDLAVEELRASSGASRAEALRALLPLLRGTVANLARVGLPGALSGPIARGDGATVAGHLSALSRRPSTDRVYRELSARAVAMALQRRTVAPAVARSLRRLLASPIEGMHGRGRRGGAPSPDR